MKDIRLNNPSLENNLEKLKKIYNIKTITGLLELLVNFEMNKHNIK